MNFFELRKKILIKWKSLSSENYEEAKLFIVITIIILDNMNHRLSKSKWKNNILNHCASSILNNLNNNYFDQINYTNLKDSAKAGPWWKKTKLYSQDQKKYINSKFDQRLYYFYFNSFNFIIDLYYSLVLYGKGDDTQIKILKNAFSVGFEKLYQEKNNSNLKNILVKKYISPLYIENNPINFINKIFSHSQIKEIAEFHEMKPNEFKAHMKIRNLKKFDITVSKKNILWYDGVYLNLIDLEKNKISNTWIGFSGSPNLSTSDKNLKIANLGALPNSIYMLEKGTTIKQESANGFLDKVNWYRRGKAWGYYMTYLKPISGNTYGRDRFFIHGGRIPGSIGCIDLVDGNESFHKWFIQKSISLLVVVSYIPLSKKQPRFHSQPQMCDQNRALWCIQNSNCKYASKFPPFNNNSYILERDALLIKIIKKFKDSL